MLLCDSSIPLTFLMKNVHSFIFHLKKKVKQSKCLSTREWESRLWSIHSGVSYSKESNELGLRAAMWTKKYIIMSEQSNNTTFIKFKNKEN